ncbi:MAG: endonuclease MutS2 [Vicinamibacterales bacterium]
MHAGALRALEFGRIVEVIRGFAQTPAGDMRLASLHPAHAPAEVRAALAATVETVRFLDAGVIGFEAPAEFDVILDGLLVEGRPLEPPQLLALGQFLASVDATCSAIRRARGSLPILAAIANRAAAFVEEVADIRRKIDASGEVVDDASPELRRLRDRLRGQRARLRGTLESYLRGKDSAKYLQQQIVTDRHGRYVLVVRAEHRASIPGIVHGSSGSGASLYLEPLSTVEINIEIVELDQQEAEEVHRILLALTDRFRLRAEDLERTVDAATELDVLNARAQFSILVRGIAPAISSESRLELRGARHPLLIPAVRRRARSAAAPEEAAAHDDDERSSPEPRTPNSEYRAPKSEYRGPSPDRDPIPVDILLLPPVRVLVVTGPNTGGKTVALKTAGLLPLLAQSGLLIPVEEGSAIPVFRSVFADIGDEQSIANSLSTFSGHIANIVAMDAALELPALVLLDEAGAGTDPIEGGALAMSIIEQFRLRNAMVIATTHYEALKTYASTTEGATPAGFGFDPTTFAPTYRLNYGAPGSSLAFEIASRLGLPPAIIERARAHRSERESQLADHLARVEREMQALEQDRRAAGRDRQSLGDMASRLQAREHDLKNREDMLRRRMDQKIEERLREARREIDAVVGRLKARTETLAAQAERSARLIPTGETGGVRADARAAIDAIEDRLRRSGAPATAAAADAPPAPARPPAVGDRVLVGGLKVEGTVKSLGDRDAEVDVRGKRLRARVDELRVVAPAASAGARPVHVTIDVQPREGSLTELNLIGCNVDEALTRAEKFLDDAVLAEQRSVRVIHGYGTGQLRRAIADWLQTHPFVDRFGPAKSDQGGGGVTVVELKE